jgi:hypothetical protein
MRTLSFAYVFYLFICVLLVCCRSATSLQAPLREGQIDMRQIRADVQCHTSDIYFFAGTDSVVRAMEGGEVLAASIVDGTWFMLIKGKYRIGYGNFSSVWVKNSEKIKRGQLIGILDRSETDSTFGVYIEREGRAVTPETLSVFLREKID